MKKELIENDRKYFIYGNDKNITVVVTYYKDMMIKGVAKCHPEDTYDEKTGIEIAKARCILRLKGIQLSEATDEMQTLSGLIEYLQKVQDTTTELLKKLDVRRNELRNIQSDLGSEQSDAFVIANADKIAKRQQEIEGEEDE